MHQGGGSYPEIVSADEPAMGRQDAEKLTLLP